MQQLAHYGSSALNLYNLSLSRWVTAIFMCSHQSIPVQIWRSYDADSSGFISAGELKVSYSNKSLWAWPTAHWGQWEPFHRLYQFAVFLCDKWHFWVVHSECKDLCLLAWSQGPCQREDGLLLPSMSCFPLALSHDLSCLGDLRHPVSPTSTASPWLCTCASPS